MLGTNGTKVYFRHVDPHGQFTVGGLLLGSGFLDAGIGHDSHFISYSPIFNSDGYARPVIGRFDNGSHVKRRTKTENQDSLCLKLSRKANG